VDEIMGGVRPTPDPEPSLEASFSNKLSLIKSISRRVGISLFLLVDFNAIYNVLSVFIYIHKTHYIYILYFGIEGY
jgi:hypothetical protein